MKNAWFERRNPKLDLEQGSARAIVKGSTANPSCQYLLAVASKSLLLAICWSVVSFGLLRSSTKVFFESQAHCFAEVFELTLLD
jgi:hypothetical protein